MQFREFLMTAEAWTIIGTGIAILVAIAASNHSIRAAIKDLRTQINEIAVRLGRVEGTLDFVRDSMFDRHDAA